MVCTQNVTPDILYVGGSDRRLQRFENLFPLAHGVSYNSYVLLDEKTVLIDTADGNIAAQFEENVLGALGARTLDYLVLQHMEPDHCALVARILSIFPQVTLVGNPKTFTMLGQFFTLPDTVKKQTVAEGDTLCTGAHTLQFFMAPMVHWPEVMVTYDQKDKVLFCADAFGTFGALDGSIFADAYDFEKEFLPDARRYYANIVGKYGAPAQTLLGKAAKLDIAVLCPLHGPVWRKNIGWFVEKYQKWSTCTPEDDGAVVVFGSMYGHTESAANAVADAVHAISGKAVTVHDVSGTHVSTLMGEIWRCGTLVLLCPTYNGGIYPPMENLLADMAALGVHHRTVALAENGTWAPTAARLMREKLAGMKDITVLENTLTIKSALFAADESKVQQFAQEIAAAM